MPGNRTAPSDDWQRAHILFKEHRERIFVALFARSLPATYCSPTGAAVLDVSAHGLGFDDDRHRRAMVGDSFRRLTRTVQFLEYMFSDPDAPSPSGPRTAAPPCDKGGWLDFIHDVHQSWIAEIEHPRHKTDQLLADPINDMQLLGACASFVVSVRETFEDHWPRRVDTADWDAWARVWLEITCRQGLTDDGLLNYFGSGGGQSSIDVESLNYDSVAAVSAEILEQNYERTLSGVRLADNLRGDLEDGVPRVFRTSISVGLGVFGSPTVNRILLLPRSPLTAPARRFASTFPTLTDAILTRYVKMVLRKLEEAPPLSPWEQLFSPSPVVPRN